MEMIKVENLCKNYRIPKKVNGRFHVIRGFFKHEWEQKEALKNVSFSVSQGEILGYVGLNGAGKSTTLKILTGVLYPTSGQVLVDGRVPHENRRKNARNIAFVAGQSQSMEWDLPLEESFLLTKKVYGIAEKQYQENIELFDHLINIKEIMDVPVRQLSLGQKMKGSLANSLLHNPKIIYLDEPTIGIDVVAKDSIRRFLKEYNKETKATIILTSHDTRDIEDLCNRIILIDKGELKFNGTIDLLNDKYMKYNRIIIVQEKHDLSSLSGFNVMVKKNNDTCEIFYNTGELGTEDLIHQIIKCGYCFEDIVIQKPSMEDIIKFMYSDNKI